MLRVYLTLIYFLSNVYVFFRIKDLFIGKSFRKWYALIYAGLVVALPNIELYTHWDKGVFSHFLSAVTGYILPLYLYVFLLVLLFDLFLLFNRMVRLVPRETFRRAGFRGYALSAIMMISAGIVVSGAINLNTIRISGYQAEIPKKKATIGHLRIAFVSDFHIKTDTPMRFIRQFVRKVNALDADLVLYGGDLLEGERKNEIDEKYESALRQVHARMGVYSVLGNHEFYARQEKSDFFRKAGITLLCDTAVNIEDSFYLAGRYDDLYSKRKNINQLLADVPDDLPVVLMDHRPTQVREVSQTKVDVQFSGHTHNGQLFPINLIVRQFYEISWGYRKIRKTHFFVSSGIRLWGPPVKTAGKSEIILADISLRESMTGQ